MRLNDVVNAGKLWRSTTLGVPNVVPS